MIGVLSVEEVQRVPTAYRTAAEYGDVNAWVTLGWWCGLPDFGKPDPDAAEAAFRSAIAAGVDRADVELARYRWFLKRETATQAEAEQALHILTASVSSNPDDAEAIYFLGMLTTGGFGCEASPERGFELQKRAAELGNADAMFELYVYFETGTGTQNDPEAALAACQQAANAGHARAMYNIGAFHATGTRLPKDMKKAVHWYQRAADEGNPSALVGLASIYKSGDGVEADPERAEQLLDEAEYLGLNVSHLR